MDDVNRKAKPFRGPKTGTSSSHMPAYVYVIRLRSFRFRPPLMSTRQVFVFVPKPLCLIPVLYDSTVGNALANIWEFLKGDFVRHDIVFSQLSLHSLVRGLHRSMRIRYLRQSLQSSPTSTKPWDTVHDRVDIAYKSGSVVMEPPDNVSEHSTLSDSTIQLVLQISRSCEPPLKYHLFTSN